MDETKVFFPPNYPSGWRISFPVAVAELANEDVETTDGLYDALQNFGEILCKQMRCDSVIISGIRSSMAWKPENFEEEKEIRNA